MVYQTQPEYCILLIDEREEDSIFTILYAERASFVPVENGAQMAFF
jgi:hypothetical protein